MNRTCKFFSFAWVWMLATSLAAIGQTTSGAIAGTVKDATGAVLPYAAVVAVNQGTKVSYRGSSSAAGEVRIENLPLGLYDVTASAKGFQRLTLTAVAIDLNKTTAETFTLGTASTSSTVEVSADAGVALDTQSLNLTQTFPTAEMEVLPSAAIGPGVLNLSLLSPNVASNGGIGQGTGPSVAGQRPLNNNFMIEGIDNNNKSVTGPLVYVPNDDVGEFSLIVGQFSPEFGHSSGGQFDTDIKSGANSFHGVAYEYFQNRNLNGLNVPAGVTEPKPRFDFNRYGGSIGGPIKRNRLFFFGGYERQTTGQDAQNYLCTPTAAGVAALQSMPGLSALNLAQYIKYTPVSPGSAGIDTGEDVACHNQATGPQFLDVYPGIAESAAPAYGYVPVYGSGTPVQIALGNYLASAPVYSNFKALASSGDYTISARDNLRLRYIYNANARLDAAAAISTFYLPAPRKYHLIAISEYHSFTPNLNNESRIGYNRYAENTSAGSFQFPGLSEFPNLVIADLDLLQYGPDPNAPQSTVQNLYEFTDDIHYSKGTHTFVLGFDGRKSISPQTFTQRVRGDYEYNYLTEYLHDLGPTCTTCPLGIKGQRSTGNFIYYGDQVSLYGFANDTWRVTPEVTLNYGIRYEFTSVPTGERAQSLNSAASYPGLVNFSAPQPQYTNFAPRLGISYAPDTKTVVRAGFGLAYDVLYDNLGTLSFPPQYSSTTNVNDPGLPPSDITGNPGFLANGGLPAGTGTLAQFCMKGTGGATGVGCSPDIAAQRGATSALIPNQVVPYSEIWTLGVERQIGSNFTAEIRYTGSRGIHLPTQDQINRQPETTAANQLTTYFGAAAQGISAGGSIATANTANTLAGVRANSSLVPAWASAGFTSTITSVQPYSSSNYNAGSLSLIRRFNHGLALNAAYTYSKTMDDATAVIGSTIFTPQRAQDSQCIACDYSRSALDRTHRLSLAEMYDLPYFKHSNFLLKNFAGNWEIALIYIYESPEYATVRSGTDANQNGDSLDRTIINPNGVRGTGSGVAPVFSNTLAQQCAPTTACARNLVGYVATNPNAYFIQAGAGTLPNAERNTLPLRPIDNVDLSVVKRISITGRYTFEFQAQAFNGLNHPQYVPGTLDSVNPTQTNTYPTAILTASSPVFNKPQTLFNNNSRTMQLSAKLTF